MTAATILIPVEQLQIGRRYMTCREGYEAGWTVERRVIRETAERSTVEIIYANGITVGAHEVGTEIAVFCDVQGVTA